MESEGSEGGNSQQVSSNANAQKGRDSIKKGIETQSDVPNAMHREDIGDITFAWGKPGDPDKDYRGGYGIAHILEKHGRDVLRKMPEVIAKGVITRVYGPKPAERLDIKLDNYIAVLSKNMDGEPGRWLLTGWDINVPR